MHQNESKMKFSPIEGQIFFWMQWRSSKASDNYKKSGKEVKPHSVKMKMDSIIRNNIFNSFNGDGVGMGASNLTKGVLTFDTTAVSIQFYCWKCLQSFYWRLSLVVLNTTSQKVLVCCCTGL